MVELTQAAIANQGAINSQEPRAVNVSFDCNNLRVSIDFNNNSNFSFLTSQVEWLANLSPEILAEVTLTPDGKGLQWETPDLDLSIQGLLRGILGSKSWLAERSRGRCSGEGAMISKLPRL
jgi:hypothetical protein